MSEYLKKKSIYHSILNAFEDRKNETHILGTSDIDEYSNFPRYEVEKALEEMYEEGLLKRESIGGNFAWYVGSPLSYTNVSTSELEPEVRKRATELERSHRE